MENKDKKIFTIAGREFEFKDLTIDETAEVQSIIGKFFLAPEKNEIFGELSAVEAKKFLFLTMKPVDGSTAPESFFGSALSSEVLNIVQAFFLMKIKLMKTSATGFAESLLRLLPQDKD